MVGQIEQVRLQQVESLDKLLALLVGEHMAGTVLEWRRTEADPDQRELKFACVLADDFAKTFRYAEGGWDTDSCLLNHLMRLASERTNWRRVARLLLQHFALPVIAASIVPVADWQEKPRLRPPVEWRGPVN